MHRAPTSRPVRRSAVLLAVVGLLIGLPGVAWSHETTPPGVQRLEISLGARQLGLTITTPPAGGGPMSVVLVPRGDTPPGPVELAVVRAGADPGPGSVPLPAAPAGRAGQARFTADQPGAWELVVTDGPGQARIPVAVAPVPPTPGWVWAVRVGAVVGLVALVVAVTPAVRRRRGLAVGAGAVAVAGLTVAVTAGLLGPSVPADPAASPAPPPAPMAGMDMGAPAAMTDHASGAVVTTVRTTPDRPQAGSPTTLELDLTDSSTGEVVDDLAVHDDALIHLAVIGPDDGLSHVHPVRVAPGRYRVLVVPSTGGRFGVFAEMERSGDGGHQVARSAFDVAGPVAPVPASPPGRQDVGGIQADVSTSPTVAGRTGRVAVTFTANGAPVGDLQSWLGMAGHPMVLGPGSSGVPDPADPASVFGHAHDMSPPGPTGRFGPLVAFDYAVARPGRYRMWVQVQRDWQVRTVPVTVDVPGP